ncbi:YopX family protein [Lactiplantibacillus plantarum]|uniref:YopX family protein n=1 Tax=Lactiplantibacillus plantarum TaxID=1590 RepID=UPI0025B5515E|nr:YopX family protein [Lactiplantibacillus plantarum]MDN3983934.1 YopX family protein [Lactiplantibacillus plantarum]
MIKFRAWSKDLSKYRKLDDISNDQGLGMFFEVQNGIGSNVTSICYSINDVVEQFTGLKDVNGKDIYEGDILENRKYRSIVKFAGGKFLADLIETIQTFDLIGETHGSKVIGNVHENPELLEADK